jgi:hypothetical protein
MGYSLLKTVFPNFGDTSTYVEHNYREILDANSSEPAAPEPLQTLSVDGKVPLQTLSVDGKVPLQTLSVDGKVPLPKELPLGTIPEYPPIKRIEAFEEGAVGRRQGHFDYSHILTCKECRDLLQKQFMKKDQVIDESLLEIGMYVLFGAFILVLLDK